MLGRVDRRASCCILIVNVPITANRQLECSMQTTIQRLPIVKARTGLSRSTIYLRISQGSFPRPVSLGGRAVGWIEAEVSDWLNQRIEASRRAVR